MNTVANDHKHKHMRCCQSS